MQLIDEYPDHWAEQTYSTISDWLSHESCPRAYLLVDAAFRHKTMLPLVRQLFGNTGWLSLYQTAPDTNDRVLSVSPLLLSINEGDQDKLDWLRQETSGQPMLSMIISAEPPEELRQRLTKFQVVTIDTERYLLRLSDTRRLPQILEMLTTEQRQLLTGGMLAWNYTGRDGSWYPLNIQNHPAEPPPDLSQPIKLEPSQVSELLEMNRIDALIDSLRLNEPAVFQAFEKPSERYRWVQATLEQTSLPVDTHAQQLECCRHSIPVRS